MSRYPNKREDIMLTVLWQNQKGSKPEQLSRPLPSLINSIQGSAGQLTISLLRNSYCQLSLATSSHVSLGITWCEPRKKSWIWMLRSGAGPILGPWVMNHVGHFEEGEGDLVEPQQAHPLVAGERPVALLNNRRRSPCTHSMFNKRHSIRDI